MSFNRIGDKGGNWNIQVIKGDYTGSNVDDVDSSTFIANIDLDTVNILELTGVVFDGTNLMMLLLDQGVPPPGTDLTPSPIATTSSTTIFPQVPDAGLFTIVLEDILSTGQNFEISSNKIFYRSVIELTRRRRSILETPNSNIFQIKNFNVSDIKFNEIRSTINFIGNLELEEGSNSLYGFILEIFPENLKILNSDLLVTGFIFKDDGNHLKSLIDDFNDINLFALAYCFVDNNNKSTVRYHIIDKESFTCASEKCNNLFTKVKFTLNIQNKNLNTEILNFSPNTTEVNVDNRTFLNVNSSNKIIFDENLCPITTKSSHEIITTKKYYPLKRAKNFKNQA